MDKAKETFLKALNAVKERWLAVGKSVRVIILSVIGAVAVALIILSIIFNQTGFLPLFSDIDSQEVSEIMKILRDELNIEDVRTSGNQILVPEDMINSVRMDMAIRGYPKSNWNYDLWNNGVDMFSTERETNEVARQQLAANISAALDTLSPVNFSRVIITPVDTQNYVLEENKKPIKVSVVLTLKDGERLKGEQIDGIYTLVEMAVAGLERKYISIIDQNAVPLVADEAPSEMESLSVEERTYYIQREFQRSIELEMYDGLDNLLNGAYRDYNIMISAEMEYGNSVTEETVYSGSNVDENGTQSGIISESIEKAAAGGIVTEGGLIGTTTNADISPDFPTLEAQAGDDMFYESVKEFYYKVNEKKSQYQSNDWSVKSVSCAVLIDEAIMAQQEIDEMRLLFANALGTSVDLVSVKAQPFPLKPNSQGGGTGEFLQSSNRNTLIFIIIALGALLIILFFLAIMTSGSKKRRHIRSKLTPAMAAATPSGKGGSAYEDELFGSVTATKIATDKNVDDDYGITSLLAEEGETREAVLKNEIREFARTNPDIVAQLIRTWMKE